MLLQTQNLKADRLQNLFAIDFFTRLIIYDKCCLEHSPQLAIPYMDEKIK